ncbi:hypothetical protein BJ742DRAFT_846558 [Cladochytrium replicatum]|nr:hypothetical protein BJ742DRAFT_846558 [Cladochytrium replicatum]
MDNRVVTQSVVRTPAALSTSSGTPRPTPSASMTPAAAAAMASFSGWRPPAQGAMPKRKRERPGRPPGSSSFRAVPTTSSTPLNSGPTASSVRNITASSTGSGAITGNSSSSSGVVQVKKRLPPYVNRYLARIKKHSNALLVSTAAPTIPALPGVPGLKDDAESQSSSESDDSSFHSEDANSDSDGGSIRKSRRVAAYSMPTLAAVSTSAVAMGSAAGALSKADKELMEQPPAGAVEVTLGTEEKVQSITAIPKTKHRGMDRALLHQIAELEEVLVPLRLDLELDGYKLQDSFMWNLYEPFITPEKFAEHLCDDLNLAHDVYIAPIAKAIRNQITEFAQVRALLDVDVAETLTEMTRPPPAPAPAATTSANGANSSPAPGKKDDESSSNIGTPRTMAINEKKKRIEKKERYGGGQSVIGEETRVVIKLDLYVGKFHIRDQFEWDLDPREQLITPEEFARILTADLGLGGECVSVISHSIHEQLFKHQHGLIDAIESRGLNYIFEGLASGLRQNEEVNFDTGGPGQRSKAYQAMLAAGNPEHWSASVEEMTAEELEKMAVGRDRGNRRIRREMRMQGGMSTVVVGGGIGGAQTTTTSGRQPSTRYRYRDRGD